MTAFRRRQKRMQEFFTVNRENTFAYCHDIENLMSEMEVVFDVDDWRLFINSSKTSLKAVLLEKTNTKPAVPIAYSTEMKECYETLKIVLQKIKYANYQFRICCDLKVVNILSGLKGGYCKHMCFICDWDSRFRGDQYAFSGWKDRSQSKNSQGSIINEPLVPRNKILLPPLHIKLGIVKKFIETVVKREQVYDSLKCIFPKISDRKLRAGMPLNTSQKRIFFNVLGISKSNLFN